MFPGQKTTSNKCLKKPDSYSEHQKPVGSSVLEI